MALFPAKQRRDLHFRYLNHAQRVAACEALSQKPIGIAVIASNKTTILDSGKINVFKQKQHLYNYLVRFLLERVTWICRERAKQISEDNARLRVIFSRRGGTDYQVMRDYLMMLRDGKEVLQPVRRIDWSVLDPNDIRVENHSVKAGLQIADVVTSATAAALEPNGFGHTEPRYALILKRRFIKERGLIGNCGLTLIPRPDRNPLTNSQRIFVQDLEK